MKLNFLVLCCSPAGTTRHVGEVIEGALSKCGYPVESCCSLGRDKARIEELLERIAAAPGRVCVFIGSPVYSSHALPLVMDFIARLPRRPETWAVPFVTWGAASSGLALAEMGDALVRRGYALAGAAKVTAVHSLMWEAKQPAGAGHPDAADDRMVKELAEKVAAGLRSGTPERLAPGRLAYQSPEAAAILGPQNLAMAKQLLPPRRVDTEVCTQCGICVASCPVSALQLEPFPVCDDQACIVCFNCVRLCPEKAFAVDLRPIHQHIIERAETFSETPPSQIFLP